MTNPRPFKAAGVIGWPVAQSRSPKLHGYWFDRYNINGAYILLPVHPDNVADAIKGLVALGFAGCNVTIPHKQAVLPLLDHIDPLAKRMGVEADAEKMVVEMVEKTPAVIQKVQRDLPRAFPQELLDRVLTGLAKSARL